jgi:hypothetical protein
MSAPHGTHVLQQKRDQDLFLDQQNAPSGSGAAWLFANGHYSLLPSRGGELYFKPL